MGRRGCDRGCREARGGSCICLCQGRYHSSAGAARFEADFGPHAPADLVLRAADFARLYLVLRERYLRTDPPRLRRRPRAAASPGQQLELPLAGAAEAQAQVPAAARR